jgi:thiamine-monophosphate kinase
MLDEFGLIARYFRPLATDPGALGLTDDAALISTIAGQDLVVTTDMLTAGIHFFPDDPPGSIARKALRVSLSDLAAKGAEPFAYLTSVALPEEGTQNWTRRFAQALKSDQKKFGVTLLGGDTIRAREAATISITALGRVPSGKAVLRSTASAGDFVYVSGTIGDAALGLQIRSGQIGADRAGHGAGRLLDRYLHPQPRVKLAPVLRRHASAAIDVSDGLLADLGHLCRASGVSAEIGAGDVPLSRPAARLVRADPDRFETVVTGGDDYEILATVAGKKTRRFESDAAAADVQVTRIGRIVAGTQEPILTAVTGERLAYRRAGHVHF